MFTKTRVFTYYNITIKQSTNKGVNCNKFLYTVNSNLQDSIYSVCIMSQTPPSMGLALQTVFKGVFYLAFTPCTTMVQLPAIVVYRSYTMAKSFDPPTHHDTNVT